MIMKVKVKTVCFIFVNYSFKKEKQILFPRNIKIKLLNITFGYMEEKCT